MTQNETVIPILTVHLREGFFQTAVIVRLNGEERYRSEATTRTQIGLAAMVPLKVPAGNVNVEILFPSLNQSIRTIVPVCTDTHLGIDLDKNSRISWCVQTEPFQYM